MGVRQAWRMQNEADVAYTERGEPWHAKQGRLWLWKTRRDMSHKSKPALRMENEASSVQAKMTQALWMQKGADFWQAKRCGLLTCKTRQTPCTRQGMLRARRTRWNSGYLENESGSKHEKRDKIHRTNRGQLNVKLVDSCLYSVYIWVRYRWIQCL